MRVKFPRLPQRPRPPAADPRLDIRLSTNLKAAAQRFADGIWTYVVRQVFEVIFIYEKDGALLDMDAQR